MNCIVCPTLRSVGLFAQKGRNIVAIHTIIDHRFDGCCTTATTAHIVAEHSGNAIERSVVNRVGMHGIGIIRSGCLRHRRINDGKSLTL